MKKLNPYNITRTFPITSGINATALNAILGHDGGNSNNPNGLSGKTNYGISDLRDGKEDQLTKTPTANFN